MTNEELKKNIEAARKRGVPEEVIQARVAEIQSQNVPASKEPQIDIPQEQSKKGVIEGILGEILNPFIKTGKNIAGAGFEAGRAGLSALGNEDMYAYDPKTGKAKVQNPFLSEDELAKFSNPKEALLDQAKSSAGVLSFAVPIGKSSSVLGKVLPKTSALRGGATSGALYGMSKDDADITSVAADALTGGVGAKVLPSLLGLGNKMVGSGRAIRESVVKPNVGSTPYSGGKIDDIMQIGRDYNFKGSARNQIKQLSNEANNIETKITKYFQKKNPEIETKAFVDDFKKSIDESTLIDQGDGGTFDRAIDQYINKLLTIGNSKGKTNGLTAKASDWLQLRRDLNKNNDVTNAFRKISGDLSSPLSAKEAVAVELYRSINQTLGNKVKGVTKHTGELKRLYSYADNLGRSASRERELSPFGIPTGVNLNRFLQGTADSTGRFLEGSGGFTNKLLKSVTRGSTESKQADFGGKYLPKALQAVLGLDSSQRTNEGYILPEGVSDEQAQELMTIDDNDTNEPTVPTISPEQYQQILLHPGLSKGSKDMVKQLYSIQKESSPDRKRKLEIKAAKIIYKQVAELALKADTGFGGSLKALSGKIPGIEGGHEEDLARETEGAAKAIANAFAKEVGVATDTDVQRWLGLMPKPGDTPAEKIRALQRLREKITEEEMNFLN